MDDPPAAISALSGNGNQPGISAANMVTRASADRNTASIRVSRFRGNPSSTRYEQPPYPGSRARSKHHSLNAVRSCGRDESGLGGNDTPQLPRPGDGLPSYFQAEGRGDLVLPSRTPRRVSCRAYLEAGDRAVVSDVMGRVGVPLPAP